MNGDKVFLREAKREGAKSVLNTQSTGKKNGEREACWKCIKSIDGRVGWSLMVVKEERVRPGS